MNTSERYFQSKFTGWLKEHRRTEAVDMTFVYELKICVGKRLPLSRIADHQISYLRQAADQCITMKISDFSPEQKPFDGWQVCQVPAYLIIIFPKPKNTPMYWIHINRLVSFIQKNFGIKSMTEADADTLGKKYVF